MHYWNTELLTARFRTRAGWTAVAAGDHSRGSVGPQSRQCWREFEWNELGFSMQFLHGTAPLTFCMGLHLTFCMGLHL